ncbi:ABC transporter ATP-binding protein [Terrabacter aerolatus]|uniref:HlyB/MsbA family ABC transporter n=1 Tax=Terrabacter aerolatus TaxID=422442 RepID=A0A512D3P9_9MICO|nr:ABC transporter ATP-binding protein [Terrabacter aerolatus]GEO31077.1 HlyB/MsbA family ABC transporter [Terrabacter aerolatus]
MPEASAERVSGRRGGPRDADADEGREPNDRASTRMRGEPLLDHMELQIEAVRQRRTWGRLVSIVTRSLRLAWSADRGLFLVTAAIQLVAAALVAVQVLAVKWVLDALLGIQSGGSVSAAVGPVLLLAGTMAVSSVSSAVLPQLQRLQGEVVARRTRSDILRVASQVDLLAFETPSFYDRLQRVQLNAVTRPLSVCQGLVGLIGSIVGSVGLAVVIASIHPVLLPLLLLSGVPVQLASRRSSRLEFAFAVDQVPRLRLREYLMGVQVGRTEANEVRAYGIAEELHHRFDQVYGDYVDALRRHVRRKSLLSLVSSVVSSIVLAGTLIIVVWLVSVGKVGLAEAGAALVAVRLLAGQLTTIASSSQLVFESGLFLDDLDHFLALAVQPAAEDRVVVDGPFQTLRIEDVGFVYPGSRQPALSGVSLEIKQGDVVALVGENGSGKSTLAKVVAGLYPATSGRVVRDEVDLRDLDRASMLTQTAVIFQDFLRYQLPAGDNIALGRADEPATDERIMAAAATVGVDEALRRLPDGLATILSKSFVGGQELSLGQWQRVALARALYRDAPFVILDEPSASLDPRAEHELFVSLRSMLRGRTALYISHRMSTVREADRIVVLHEGRVVESGSHEELIELGGRYAELFRLQASAFIEPTRG